ncbi:MAG: methionyl-tRNA formyltransferase, partial [Bacteroidetes bacterium]|nr:methionyl-tRNA formyltransferase [Bacteroidota bacterium]
KMPRLGTFNLHGSLLPQYRGAAPINWAIINGEKETGVSTFFLQHEIDTGKIIFREKITIAENNTAGEIHDKLMMIGAKLVLKTVQAIEQNNYPQTDQSELISADEKEKHAPKIFKEDCRIDWNKSLNDIHNLIRGLSPYPAAYATLTSPDGKTFPIKIFRTEKEINSHSYPINSVITDSKTFLKIAVNGGFISINDLQLAGKKRMSINEFLRGFPVDNNWKIVY